MSVEVCSVDEVGLLLGCSRRRVFGLLAEGVLERAPRYGREVRIYRASVDRALAPRTKDRSRARRPSRAGFELSEVPL